MDQHTSMTQTDFSWRLSSLKIKFSDFDRVKRAKELAVQRLQLGLHNQAYPKWPTLAAKTTGGLAGSIESRRDQDAL